jgi:two-component system OmpR family sensor kinase
MVEELLEFTRMQDGRFTLNVQTADIRAEFEDTVFMYGSRLKQEGIELDVPRERRGYPRDPVRCLAHAPGVSEYPGQRRQARRRGKEALWRLDLPRGQGEIVVRIRDFGPGIPEDELPHVKMKFYKGRSKARGSGIGLAVCEEIVTMHGGTLTLENAEGGGTLVTIAPADQGEQT